MTAPRFATTGRADGWHVVPYEITWRDLDAAGHVNNAVFFTLFEWGRTRYWLDLEGGGKPDDVKFIVARAECNFRRQLEMMDRILIRTRIGEIRSSSFDFESELRMEADGTVAADGKVIAVLFDWENNSKRPVSKEMREKIAVFQKE